MYAMDGNTAMIFCTIYVLFACFKPDGVLGLLPPYPMFPSCAENCECRFVEITCRGIVSVPTNFTEDVSSYTEFICVGCELRNLGNDSFQELTRLKKIVFKNSHIVNFAAGVFSNLEDLEYLDLSHNPLTNQSIRNVICSLSLYSNQVELYLEGINANSEIARLSSDAFACLRMVNMSLLDLTGSLIDSETVKNIFCNLGHFPAEIHMSNTFISIPFPMKIDIFSCLENKEIISLDISQNIFINFNKEVFKYLPDLQQLRIYNSRSYLLRLNMEDFQALKKLKILDLGHNELQKMPSFYALKGVIHFPQLTSLFLHENRITYLTPFPKFAVPKLEILTLSDNLSPFLRIPHGFIENLDSFKRLDMNHTKLDEIQELAFRSNSLEVLDLSDSLLKFQYLEKISHKIFFHAKNLRDLKLSGFHNHEQYLTVPFAYFPIWETLFRKFFQNLYNLERLFLDRTAIEHLYADMFANTTNLVYLQLSDNRIQVVEDNIFEKLRGQTTFWLDMSNNKLTTVNESMLPSDKSRAMYLNFGQNPFTCDCSLYWFQEFVRENPFKIMKRVSDHGYHCQSPLKLQGTDLENFNPSWESCFQLPLQRAYITTATSTAALILAVFIFSIIYRVRWHLRFWYINLRAKRKHYQSMLDDSPFLYDAFVAYARTDTDWVVKTLYPILEKENRLKLCLHDRDWAVGKDIADNIMESINASRKVVLVITNAFTRSQWCQLELTMAQHKLFSDDRDNLILIIKEDILSCNLTPRLALQMKMKTYILWSDTEQGQRVFWKRLVRAINKPVGSTRHAPVPHTMTEM